MLHPRRLPSLNGIRAFEAAARTGAFTAAATELAVTPAAVSRLVHLLEDRLGVALFDRHANRLALTPAGEAYRAGLTPLLDGLARLTAEIVARKATPVLLTVGVGQTFAIRWLIPRLAAFTRREPGIEVRIATGGSTIPFSEDWTCDIRLRSGTEAWPGLAADRIVAADLLPVCAPAIAARLAGPADLARETLLRVAHAPEDWTTWATGAGIAPPQPRGPVFEAYGCRPRWTASASPWASAPTSTTTSPPAASSRPSHARCRRRAAGPSPTAPRASPSPPSRRSARGCWRRRH